MTITRLADVIQPEVFTPYVVQRTMELSELIRSGIAENNEEFDRLASGSNKLVHLPYWSDLEGDPDVMLDSGQHTPGKIEAGEDVARKLAFVKGFGANGLSAYLSGDDPMRVIADRIAAYWERVYQKALISTLEGAFASGSMSDKVLDITNEDDPLLSGETFLDALQLMGDAKDLLTGVMMHSAVETYLAKRQLIEYVQESEQNPRVPYFMNKRVIVDDGMIYNSDTKEGVMYLFGRDAIAWGNGSHPNILQTEMVRDGLSYSGEDVLMSRRIAILHPRGVKWLETNLRKDPSNPAADPTTNPTLPFPNFAALEFGGNWQLEYEPKAVRIVKFVFSIDDSDNGESQ